MNVDKDIFAGLFFVLLGSAGLYIGADYAFGTPARMGAGFLPRLLCLALIGMGGLIALVGLIRNGPGQDKWDWAQLGWILLAVLVFATAMETIGLALATMIAAIIARMGSEATGSRQTLLVALSVAAMLAFMALGTPLGGRLGAALIPGTGLRPAVLAIATAAGLAAAVPAVARLGARGIGEALIVAAVLGLTSVLVFVKGLGLAMKMWPGA